MNNDNQSSIISSIAKNSSIIFFGLVTSTILGLIGRILFAIFYSSEEYGIFIIGLTIANVFSIIGLIGLKDGITRQIAFYEGKGDLLKVKSVVSWSFLFGLVSSIILTTLLIFCSDFIAINIFNNFRISVILKIFALSIPFYIFLFILTSIYRGFKKTKEKVIFSDILRNVFFPIFLIFVLVLNLSYRWGIFSYIASVIVTLLLFYLYFLKDKKIIHGSFKNFNLSIGKELLIFSLPLLGLTILFQIIQWTDTFMIGYYLGESFVGIYNTASPLGHFVSFPLGAVSFIYAPIVANLLAKNNTKDIKKTYMVITKWLTCFALPLFLIFLLYPNSIIILFFGTKYISASVVLQIIAIGYFVNILLGPDGDILIPMGKTTFLMWATFIAAIINISLNAFLIPIYGINGAAIASIISLISINLIRISKLYLLSNIHPFKKNILAPTFLTIISILLLFYFFKIFLFNAYFTILLSFLLTILLFLIFVLATNSIDQADIELFIQIQLKTGIKSNFLLKLMKKILNLIRK